MARVNVKGQAGDSSGDGGRVISELDRWRAWSAEVASSLPPDDEYLKRDGRRAFDDGYKAVEFLAMVKQHRAQARRQVTGRPDTSRDNREGRPSPPQNGRKRR
jgi:hypothetical protein